jgi:hypothetical protein
VVIGYLKRREVCSARHATTVLRPSTWLNGVVEPVMGCAIFALTKGFLITKHVSNPKPLESTFAIPDAIGRFLFRKCRIRGQTPDWE